jgi:hypothetical protein
VRNHLKTEFAAWSKHISQNGGEIEQHVWSRRGRDRNFEEFITILDNAKQ